MLVCKELTHGTTSYMLAMSYEEIQCSDGYLEFHTCGYPIYWSYQISDGDKGNQYYEAVDIVEDSPRVFCSLERCPECLEKLEVRVIGRYESFKELEEDTINMISKYLEQGDSDEFKIALQEVGLRLGLI